MQIARAEQSDQSVPEVVALEKDKHSNDKHYSGRCQRMEDGAQYALSYCKRIRRRVVNLN
jgi:hypothetical protein